MVTLDIIGQLYAVSATVGTAFLALSILSGRIGHGHGAGSHTGPIHGGGAHAGGLSHAAGHGGGHHSGALAQNAARVSGIGHGTAHTSAVGHGGSHSGASAHSGAQSATANHAAGHPAGHNSAPDAQSGRAGRPGASGAWSAKAGMSGARSPSGETLRLAHLHPPANADEELAERIFALVNPFFMAVFLTFFGLTGLLLVLSNKSLGIISLIPAVIVALVVNWLLKSFIRWMFEKLESSSSAVAGELIGQPAAVCVPIAPDRVGEITYIIQSKRYNHPAKAIDPTANFLRGTQVMISEMVDNIAYVEPWTDSFEPDFKDILPGTQLKVEKQLPDSKTDQE